jgi:hypothetical protein
MQTHVVSNCGMLARRTPGRGHNGCPSEMSTKRRASVTYCPAEIADSEKLHLSQTTRQAHNSEARDPIHLRIARFVAQLSVRKRSLQPLPWQEEAVYVFIKLSVEMTSTPDIWKDPFMRISRTPCTALAPLRTPCTAL